MSIDRQKVMMGVAQWDRSASRELSEAEAYKTKTAGYLADAMNSLQKAKRASGHRKLKKGTKALASALARAHEACKRAKELCYQAGETYEVAEP